jgi:hypothetical protein
MTTFVQIGSVAFDPPGGVARFHKNYVSFTPVNGEELKFYKDDAAAFMTWWNIYAKVTVYLPDGRVARNGINPHAFAET